MKKLLIGQCVADRGGFALPLDLVTQTIAILAKKGAGKSYTASVMIEELLDAGQIPVVIDPTGAWWGLKASADGKSPAYPMVVFGGEHADLPLEEGAGEATARVIVEQRFPAIIDLSLFRKGQVRRFITPFLETIYRLNRLHDRRRRAGADPARALAGPHSNPAQSRRAREAGRRLHA